MRYQPLESQLFIENRNRFSSRMLPGTVAFFNSNDEMPRTGDANYPFRQNSDIYYLSGIDQEKSLLVICPDHPLPQYREVLFLLQTNEHIAIWEGHKYTREEARLASGIQSIFWLQEMEPVFSVIMNHSTGVYVNINENDRFYSEVPYKESRFANQLKQRYPGHTFYRSGPILAALRAIKAQTELEAMQTAMNITEKAFRRILPFVKPGVAEYEIEAEITHEFIRNRSAGHAYTPIIASGRNACVLHYIDNSAVCNDGDVLLMDFGAEYANYCADLSRSIPVNGRFTQRQKDVYNAVLRVMKQATAMLVPGNTIEKYHVEVGKIMEQELIGLGLLDKDAVAKQNPASPLYKKYFMHGTSHFLGLDVHDIGNKYEPMAAGMVFTCEPGIYILEENLGIRIENDVLITANGPMDMMGNIPIEADDIEALMAEGSK